MNRAAANNTITVGALGVRFLTEAADSNGSAAVFECYVPANALLVGREVVGKVHSDRDVAGDALAVVVLLT